MSSLVAHAVPGIDFRFPIPVWLYALGAGLVVLGTALVALAPARPPRDEVGRDLYPRIRPLRLGAIGLALTTALFVLAVAGGLFGAQGFFDNPMTVLTWVDFWVGLGIVSALVGNVWDAVSPLSAAGRWLERSFAARGTAVLRYPERLGIWPATVLLLVWTWLELVWPEGREPRTLAVLAIVYVAVQLVGMAAFGTETWLARCELFTVFARTLSRFAPFETFVRRPAGPCRAGRCGTDGERIGCPDCWLAAGSEQRGLRLRPYGSGVHREPSLEVGGGTFVLAALATVVFDGFSQTQPYADVEAWVIERSGWLAAHPSALETLLGLVSVALFAIAFVAVCALVARGEPGDTADVTRRYAPTLVPIAAVYFVSHYFLYLVYAGQVTGAVVLDPLDQGWFRDYAPWDGVPGAVVWYLQVALIVWGHVVAVREAHRAGLSVNPEPRTALAAQLPLVLLMVGYTFTGLWVLGQTLLPA
jgi:hypothetical protein